MSSTNTKRFYIIIRHEYTRIYYLSDHWIEWLNLKFYVF